MQRNDSEDRVHSGTGTRGPVRQHSARMPGHGHYISWTRTIAGVPFNFSIVTMPNGDRRYVVSRYNGYTGGLRFACAWTQVHFITVTPGT